MLQKMLTFFGAYRKQFRKPTGVLGRYVGHRMNKNHTRVRRWGLALANIPLDATVLDMGCGGGATVHELAEGGERRKIFGLDYAPDMVALSRELNHGYIQKGQVEILQGDVGNMPFKDNFFDWITAFETTYFWPDFPGACKEIFRVLKEGGKVLIANEAYKAPAFEERNALMEKKFGVALHSPEEYEALFLGVGFAKKNITVHIDGNTIGVVGEK